MTEEILKKVIEHVDTYPERAKLLRAFERETFERFDSLDRKIDAGLKHPEPAAKTIAMIGQMKDEMDDKMDEVKRMHTEWIQTNDILIRGNSDKLERVIRVLFGDPLDKDDNGIHGMMKEMRNRIVADTGFWDRLFFIAKVSGAFTAIGFLIAGVINYIKKY